MVGPLGNILVVIARLHKAAAEGMEGSSALGGKELEIKEGESARDKLIVEFATLINGSGEAVGGLNEEIDSHLL